MSGSEAVEEPGLETGPADERVEAAVRTFVESIPFRTARGQAHLVTQTGTDRGKQVHNQGSSGARVWALHRGTCGKG